MSESPSKIETASVAEHEAALEKELLVQAMLPGAKKRMEMLR